MGVGVEVKIGMKVDVEVRQNKLDVDGQLKESVVAVVELKK